MKTNTKMIYFSILLLILNSCANIETKTATQATEKQWLLNLACAFPCWQQITPQTTNFNDTVSILGKANIPITVTGRTENEISFQFQNNISGIIQSTTNGTVNNIILDLYYQKVTLDDILQILGQPEKVRIGKSLYDGDKCSVLIVFQKKGILLDLFPHSNHADYVSEVTDCQVDVDMNSQIFRIVLIGNINTSEFWRSASYSGLDYIEWKGYGTYNNR